MSIESKNEQNEQTVYGAANWTRRETSESQDEIDQHVAHFLKYHPQALASR